MLEPNENKPYMYTYEEVSYGKWMLTLLLQAIPIVGLVCLIYWAVSVDDGRKNYAKAVLTYYGIYVVFVILVFAMFGSMLSALL